MTMIRKLFSNYMDWLKSIRQSQATTREKFYRIREFVGWLENQGIGHPRHLTNDHLERYQKALARQVTGAGMPLKAGTVNAKIHAVNGFIGYLKKQGEAVRTLANMHPVKEPSNLPFGVVPYHELKTMLERIDTTTNEGFRNRTIIELMFSCGLRACELSGLDVADIRFEDETITVMGKGRKQRTVPAGRTALAMAKAYIRTVRPFMLSGTPTTQALFVNRHGTRIQYHTLRKIIQRCTNGTLDGIHVTTHSFRKSCATEMIKANANIYHVKEILGHESLETLKRYTRLTIADLKETHRRCHPRAKA
jgi:site-specific recombinase XerD